jgi:RNA polymerase sigma-70 factor (ECF subfamily)
MSECRGSGAAAGGIGRAICGLGNGGKRREEANRIAESRMAEHVAHRQALLDIERKRSLFERDAVPHMDALYNFALRMTVDRSEAEDLVQETYLKAFRFFDKFEQGTNCKAWLFRIMKNSYINRYRRSQKSPATVDYGSVEEFYYTIRGSASESGDLQESLFANMLDDEVTTAIERLPDEFRSVVILCDIEGFTYEEIAEFVDCPVGTVRSRLHRGRKLLRDSLVEYASRRGYVPLVGQD